MSFSGVGHSHMKELGVVIKSCYSVPQSSGSLSRIRVALGDAGFDVGSSRLALNEAWKVEKGALIRQAHYSHWKL